MSSKKKTNTFLIMYICLEIDETLKKCIAFLHILFTNRNDLTIARARVCCSKLLFTK